MFNAGLAPGMGTGAPCASRADEGRSASEFARH